MKKLALTLFLTIATVAGIFSQSTDTFDIAFKHDFENNTLGTYDYDEWLKDWNYPDWANRQVPPTIEQNTDPENGSKVMRWHYPEGSLGPSEGGGQWFAQLEKSYDELYFSFRMKLKPGFVWVMGGKIHGLIAEPFKGFEIPEWDEGAMVLLMWRENRPTFYYYHQDQDHYYGNSEGWNFTLQSGKWYTITIRMVMNTIGENGGNNDGLMEGFVDGKLYCQMPNMRFRNLESIKIDVLEITSFFGGGDDNWRAQRDEWMDVDDFIAFNYTNAVNVPRGNTLSPKDRVLILPGHEAKKTVTTPPVEPEDTEGAIKVMAYGSEVNGEYAHFKLLVNNKYVGETYVTSAAQTYSFEPDFEVNDDDTVYIVFDNDKYISSEQDRNLVVRSLTVNGKDYDPNSKNVVFTYDSDEGTEVEYGSNYLSWDGQLVFFLGEDELVLDDIYSLFNPEVTIANNPPVVNNKSYLIPDNMQSGTAVGTITATDPDTDQQLSYSIVGGNLNNAFSINSSAGELSVNNSSGLKSTDVFNLLVKAMDDGPGNLSDTGLITINVQHIDTTVLNNQPLISNQEFSISEDDDFSSLEMKIAAIDPDDGQSLTYSILSGNDKGAFSLNSISGKLTVSNASKLDFQDQSAINLKVQVQDDGEGFLKNSATVKINLIPEITTFYIDPQNANDALEDGSLEHPYDSWSDISWEEGNSYMQKRGTTTNEGKINIYANNVTLGAYGEGESPVINSSASDFAIRAFEKSDITIRDLKIIADEAISCIYFLGASCDNNLVEKCYLEGADNGLRIIDGKTITLKYNTFSGNSDAIYSYAETTKIYYNIFKENDTGVNISSYLSSTEIYNNVFYDNTKAVSTSYSSLTIYNNIFYLLDKGDQAINHQMDNLVSDNNIFYPEQDGFLDIGNKKYSTLYEFQQSEGLDLNSFTSDPLFKDIYNDNFSVESESPAIDRGRDVGLLMDFYGYSVPSGREPDIGLIESLDDNIVSSVDPFGMGGDEESPLVFPNPSDGRFKITFSSTNFLTSELQVKDMSGNLIYRDYISSDDIDPTAQIDISHVPNGIYLLMLAIDDKVYTQRIIIN
jgi:hypothetical protein